MSIKIAIHSRNESAAVEAGWARRPSYSDRWIEYCCNHGVDHKIVNGFSSDIINQLRDCDGFLWHFGHTNHKELMMARHVLRSAEELGLTVFPDNRTSWHFDDKIAQKYLLESIGAPIVPTHVFYKFDEVLAWLKHARFPLVGKLRSGAGSSNVRLIKNYTEAYKHCKRMFSTGLSPAAGCFTDAATRARNIRDWKEFFRRLQRMPRVLWRTWSTSRERIPEKGYAYFQDFIPDNHYDIRIAVVGNRAWGYRRQVRKNDFRASGSKAMDYDPAGIDLDCVRIAFDVAKTLRLQSSAFDFVVSRDDKPLIVEMSYCFGLAFVPNVHGYWSPDLQWHEEHILPQDAILADLIEDITHLASDSDNTRDVSLSYR